MNERIQELSLQASDSIPDDVSAEHAMYLFQKKFAELIVRECSDLFEIEWGEEKLTGNDVGYVLKKHFGVGE